MKKIIIVLGLGWIVLLALLLSSHTSRQKILVQNTQHQEQQVGKNNISKTNSFDINENNCKSPQNSNRMKG